MQNRHLWWIVLGLSLGPAVSNGFARFAYGLLLPSMQSDLGWNYTVAGFINTANAIGYLIGALLALALVQRVGAARMFIVGMVVTTVALFCSGLSREVWQLSGWRVVAGIGSAPVFIAGGALASALFSNDPVRNALAIALYFGGGGFGMLLTGLVLPLQMEWFGAHTWPIAWLLLGLASAAALWPSIAAARAIKTAPTAAADNQRGGLAIASIIPALVCYFMFGIGYFVYMTFLVAWMREQGEGVFSIVLTWSLLGVMVMISPFVWRRVLAASSGGVAMALALAFTGLGTLFPLLVAGAAGILLSAVLFGLAFFMVPTAVTNFSRKNYPQSQWGAAVALFTTVFAIGQMIGPAAAGLVADYSESLAPGMAVAGGAMLFGAVVGVAQKPLVQVTAE